MTQIQHLTSLFGGVHWRSIYFLPLLFGLLPLHIQFSQGISSFFPIKNVLRLIFFILLHLVILGPRPSNFPSIPIVFQALYRINPTTSFLLVRVVVFEGSCFIEFTFITVWFRVFSLYYLVLLQTTTLGCRNKCFSWMQKLSCFSNRSPNINKSFSFVKHPTFKPFVMKL